ncbi:MAG: Rrf2 family transcriptional regulator [Candidatus Cloacimonetes bacterium]|nr:Rrf2 family transcriptional regulator [Candidatus Cloacimonadota bacterium]
MQLTTKTEYAIRGLIELAMQPAKKPLAIRELCEKQNLPIKYMEQIFRKLKSAGLLNSIKGAYGGYILNRPPSRISLKEIMSAIDDQPVKLNCCGKEGQRSYCVGEPCDFFNVWEEIESELDTHLSQIHLSRFLNEAKE